MVAFFFASLLTGVMAGISAGLFGLGGGVIIVPILAWILPHQGIPDELVMIMAVATSLASIVFTAFSSAFAHHQRGYVLWERVRYLSFGIIIGVAGGTFIAELISAEQLRMAFVLFLFYSAVQIFLQVIPEKNNSETEEMPLLDYIAGIVIGIISSLTGTGGGTLTVPYLIYQRVSVKNAVAISSACSFPIAIAASISYAILGFKHSALPDWSFGYIYLPAFIGITICSVFTAPIGAKLAHILPAAQLKRYFAFMLLLIGIKMLWR
jgi:uncharacterized membrane protein YfcA